MFPLIHWLIVLITASLSMIIMKCNSGCHFLLGTTSRSSCVRYSAPKVSASKDETDDGCVSHFPLPYISFLLSP